MPTVRSRIINKAEMIEKVSLELLTSQTLVKSVIDHQFRELAKHMKGITYEEFRLWYIGKFYLKYDKDLTDEEKSAAAKKAKR